MSNVGIVYFNKGEPYYCGMCDKPVYSKYAYYSYNPRRLYCLHCFTYFYPNADIERLKKAADIEALYYG